MVSFFPGACPVPYASPRMHTNGAYMPGLVVAPPSAAQLIAPPSAVPVQTMPSRQASSVLPQDPNLRPSVPPEELAALGVSYMPPEELASMLLHSSDLSRQVAIIDLRSYDYAGGHVRGSIQVPHGHIWNQSQLDQVIARLSGAQKVVFHCMISMHRAPQCAKIYKQRLMQMGRHQEVAILRGGYNLWRSLYSGNPALIEDETTNELFARNQQQLGMFYGQQVLADLPYFYR
mmetsp:Transcript_66132/g.123395  ORF Transcript_66132/g.123395 Transcript_66132/m.123395 type:complete len:232 (-) Transcript_66132:106-801(-)